MSTTNNHNSWRRKKGVNGRTKKGACCMDVDGQWGMSSESRQASHDSHPISAAARAYPNPQPQRTFSDARAEQSRAELSRGGHGTNERTQTLGEIDRGRRRGPGRVVACLVFASVHALTPPGSPSLPPSAPSAPSFVPHSLPRQWRNCVREGGREGASSAASEQRKQKRSESSSHIRVTHAVCSHFSAWGRRKDATDATDARDDGSLSSVVGAGKVERRSVRGQASGQAGEICERFVQNQ